MPFLEGVCVRVGTDRTTGTGKGNHSCVKEIYLFIILKIIIVTITDHSLCVTHVLGTILNKEQDMLSDDELNMLGLCVSSDYDFGSQTFINK